MAVNSPEANGQWPTLLMAGVAITFADVLKSILHELLPEEEDDCGEIRISQDKTKVVLSGTEMGDSHQDGF